MGTTKFDRSKVLRTTYGVVSVCQACFFIYVSLQPYLYRQYGVDTVTFGYIQSAAAILQLLLSPLLGRYGDVSGARAVLVLSAVCTACSHLLLGLATSLPLLLLSRLAAVGQDVRLGAQLMISDVLPGEQKGAGMGKVMFFFSVGMLLGPVIGGQLAAMFGQQSSLLVTSLAPVICIIAMVALIPSDVRRESSTPKSQAGQESDKGKRVSMLSLLQINNVKLLLFVRALVVIPYLTFAQNITVMSMTVFKLSPRVNGLILSYNGMINVVLSGVVIGLVTTRWTSKELMKWTPIISVISYAILSQTTALWTILVVLIPWNLANLVIENQIISLLTESVPRSSAGMIVGLNATIFQLGRVTSPIIGSYLMSSVGFNAIGYLGLVFSILLATVMHLKTVKTPDIKAE